MRILAFLAILAGLALTQDVRQGKFIPIILLKWFNFYGSLKKFVNFFPKSLKVVQDETQVKAERHKYDQVSPDKFSLLFFRKIVR